MICSYATLAIIRSTICACFTIAILLKDKRIPRIMAISTQCCPRIIVAIIAVTSISATVISSVVCGRTGNAIIFSRAGFAS